jgi:hypothetical protein
MIVYLARHALYLLVDVLRQVGMARGGDEIGLVGKHSERSLKAVRKVSGRRESASERLFAIFQQRIQIVDQRLNLSRVDSLDPARSAYAHGHQALAQSAERREPLARPEERSTHENQSREDRHGRMRFAQSRQRMQRY